MRMIPCEISIFDPVIPAPSILNLCTLDCSHRTGINFSQNPRMCLRKGDPDLYDGLRLVSAGAQEAWHPEVLPYLADVVWKVQILVRGFTGDCWDVSLSKLFSLVIFVSAQCLPLAVLLLWWGIRLSATPLQNKGVNHIAAQNYRAQMQLFVFVLAGVLAAVGAMRFAGRI